MKKLAAILMAGALTFALAGCGAKTEPAQTDPEPAADPTTAVEPAPEPRVVTVTDALGETVTVTGDVERVVNLWPACTSSFYVMGAGDLLVGIPFAGGVNSWVKLLYPNAENLNALGTATPAVEELIKIDPDLVIVPGSGQMKDFASQVRAAGIPTMGILFSNYPTMISAYTQLGEVLGGEYQERLATWCDMVQKREAEIQKITANIPDEERPVVYYMAGVSDSLTNTVGANMIAADWTKLGGGVYASTLMAEPNATDVTAEEIFKIDPDVIIIGGSYQHILYEKVMTTEGWKELKAVKNGHVYTNPFGAFNWDRFGLESYLQMGYAFMCIQPELAEANGFTYDALVDETIEFYKTMNGIEFTRAQIENMIAGLEPDGSEAMIATQSGMVSGGGSGGQSAGSGQGQKAA